MKISRAGGAQQKPKMQPITSENHTAPQDNGVGFGALLGEIARIAANATHSELGPELNAARIQRALEMHGPLLACDESRLESSWLLSERALRLCHAIERAPASEQLTKCSVLAAQLRAELETYEATRPLTEHEQSLIRDGWTALSAFSPNTKLSQPEDSASYKL